MQRNAEELSRVTDLLRTHPQGLSITDIAEKLGKNKHSVGRYLDILHASGHVDMRTFGMAKVYTLSSRVPLSAMLSYSTDLILVVDRYFRVLQANDPFLALTGLDKEQVIFQEIQYIPARDSAVHSFLSVLMEQIRLQEDLNEVELKQDQSRYFHLRVVPTVFDDGSGGTTVILEDITNERLALDEIRKSKKFFEDIIENITDGLMVVETNGKGKEILLINNRFTEITGYNREEFATMEPAHIVGENDKSRFGCKYKAMEDHPSTIQDLSFWAVRKDGESRYLNGRMSSVRYGDKNRVYVLVSDMTEKQHRQEQQELQWTIMRRVVDQIPYPICCYQDNDSIFLVNTAFCNLYSCRSEEEIAGKKLGEILLPQYYTALVSGNQELREKGGHDVQSVLIPSHDGVATEVPVEKSVVSIGKGNDQYIFCVIITDVSGNL